MAQGRFTKIKSMNKLIRASMLSIKNSLSLWQEHAQPQTRRRSALHEYLAPKKQRPPRTLQ